MRDNRAALVPSSSARARSWVPLADVVRAIRSTQATRAATSISGPSSAVASSTVIVRPPRHASEYHHGHRHRPADTTYDVTGTSARLGLGVLEGGEVADDEGPVGLEPDRLLPTGRPSSP